MTARPVPDAALHRLRRGYQLLMLLVALPVLGALAYVLVLQFRIVWVGTERQIAMSTDRRMTRLDGTLAPMRDNLLRLRNAVRDPGLPRAAVADRAALARLGDPDTWGMDVLPSVLHDHSPQVLLAGPAWREAEQRHAAVDRAVQFAERARLALSQGVPFRRVHFVDPVSGELWVYPWVRSADLLAELKVASVAEAQQVLARCAEVPGIAPAAFDDTVGWQVQPGADGTPMLGLSARLFALAGSLEQHLQSVCADLPLAALEGARLDAGIGRFWLVDAQGRALWKYATRDDPGGALAAEPPPFLEGGRIARAMTAPLAVPTDGVVMSARGSTIAPWTGVYASDANYVRRLVFGDMAPYIGGGAMLLVLFAVSSTLLWRRFGQPALGLVDYVHRKALDPAAPEPPLPGAWAPWMHVVRDTFAAGREAQAREAQAQALKSAIVDHALSAIVTTDAQGLIVEFNPAAQAMFGLGREAALGRTVTEVMVPPRHREAHEEGMRRMAAGGAPRVMGKALSMHALRADGSEFPMQMSLWKTDVEGITYYTASINDISEQVRAAQTIERQRDALRQSEKLTAMGSLLAGVAHELNNPLAIVLGRAALLEEKSAGQAAVADDARRIREAAERCARIVRTFLNMARSKPAERAPVQLNDLARAAADILAYNLRTHGVTLALALDPALPVVMADGDQIGQIVLNLLVNAQQALAATPPAQRQVTLATGVEQRREDSPGREQRVWLRVSDSGPGVRADLRDRLFEPYFTTKAEGSGTGLGLAVSRSIARDHGGDLTLEGSSVGASFRLSLPRSGQAEASVSEPVPLDAAPAGAARILVVDDEPEIADLLRELLEAAGHEVMTAESGAVALALLEEARFDAVVSDLHMPDVDGAALWREIKARQPALARRMLFVTGDTLSPSVRQFLDDARCTAMNKPFTREALLAHVGEMLARG